MSAPLDVAIAASAADSVMGFVAPEVYCVGPICNHWLPRLSLMLATVAVFGAAVCGDHFGTTKSRSPAFTLRLPSEPPAPTSGRKWDCACTKLGGGTAPLLAPTTDMLLNVVAPEAGAFDMGPLTRVAPPPTPRMNPSSE